MGLDLYHWKVVAEPVNLEDHLYLDVFSEFDLPENILDALGFHHFVRDDIPDVECLHAVRFFSSHESMKAHIDQSFPKDDWENRCLVGTPESCKDELSRIAREMNLGQNPNVDTERFDYPDGTYRITQRNIVIWCRSIRRKGFYYIEAGYQRKGMNEHFHNAYREGPHVEKSRFLALASFLFLDIDEDDPREENIARNFIENYEPGRSILWVMY